MAEISATIPQMNGDFDFERIWEGKRKMRRRLAAAPITEKLRMLDALRERALAIRGRRVDKITRVEERPPSHGKERPKHQ